MASIIWQKMLTIFAIQFNIYNINALQWQQSSITTALLSNKDGCFIGTNNNGSIFLLGGKNTPTSLIEYNTLTQIYTNHTNMVSFGHQRSQNSLQIDNILYMLPHLSSIVTAYNLNTLTVENTFSSFPGYALQGRCMAHFDTDIFVIGGFTTTPTSQYSKATYILDTEADTWSVGPFLPTNNEWHSCNTIESAIYVIGGWPNINKVYQLKLELASNNCCDGTWSEMSNTLTRRQALRSIAYKSKIYLLGGYDGATQIQRVDTIDTETGDITQGSNMLYKKNRVASILLNDVLYVFGGFPTGSTNEAYQYAIIPTYYPTNYPSLNPSNYPSLNPSNYPSLNPSNYPSANPSNFPASNPSNFPSSNPSNFPSSNPSYFPSSNPSNSPSLNPSNPSQPTPVINVTPKPTARPIATTNVLSTNTIFFSTEKDIQQTEVKQNYYKYAFIVVSSVLVCCIVLIMAFYVNKKRFQEMKNENNIIDYQYVQLIGPGYDMRDRAGEILPDMIMDCGFTEEGNVDIDDEASNTVTAGGHIVDDNHDIVDAINNTNKYYADDDDMVKIVNESHRQHN